MNKAQLVTKIAEKTNFTKKDSEKVLKEMDELSTKIMNEHKNLNLYIILGQGIYYGVANECMNKMKEMGLRFYLDDFGTGYSSVMNVMKLPLALIKIDKSLIYEAIANSHHYKLLSGLCEAFRESGLGVLAEGVETKEQLLSIQDLRIDCIQGFLFAKPMYQKEIIQFLIEKSSLVMTFFLVKFII